MTMKPSVDGDLLLVHEVQNADRELMEMQSPKMPSKCLIIKSNKYNRMCFFWYVAKSLTNG